MHLDFDPNWDEVRALVLRSYRPTAPKLHGVRLVESHGRGGGVTPERKVASGND